MVPFGVVTLRRKRASELRSCGLVPSRSRQAREELAYTGRRLELSVHARGTAADGKRQPVVIGHDREHRFVRDIVADEQRTAALERLMRHQLMHAGRLGES